MANRKKKVKFGPSRTATTLSSQLNDEGAVTFKPIGPGSMPWLDAEGDNDPFYADDSVYYMCATKQQLFRRLNWLSCGGFPEGHPMRRRR